jgi:hypothetical protein
VGACVVGPRVGSGVVGALVGAGDGTSVGFVGVLLGPGVATDGVPVGLQVGASVASPSSATCVNVTPLEVTIVYDPLAPLIVPVTPLLTVTVFPATVYDPPLRPVPEQPFCVSTMILLPPVCV